MGEKIQIFKFPILSFIVNRRIIVHFEFDNWNKIKVLSQLLCTMKVCCSLLDATVRVYMIIHDTSIKMNVFTIFLCWAYSKNGDIVRIILILLG